MNDVTPGMKRVEKNIDGFIYSVATLDAYAAIPVFDKVAKVLFPTFEAISMNASTLSALAQGAEAMADVTIVARVAIRALSAGTQKLNASDLRYCIDAFTAKSTVQVNGQQAPELTRVFAAHFSGRMTSMWKWFYFCLEVNFADFLDEARAMMTRAGQKQRERQDENSEIAKASQPSESPEAPTGESGAS